MQSCLVSTDRLSRLSKAAALCVRASEYALNSTLTNCTQADCHVPGRRPSQTSMHRLAVETLTSIMTLCAGTGHLNSP